MKNLFDLYEKYWRPFGELLTDMERQGFYMDKPHLEVIILLLLYFNSYISIYIECFGLS